MDEFSADTGDLGRFVDAGGRFVDLLHGILSEVDRKRSLVLAEVGHASAPPSSSGSFEELIGRALQANRFVASIVESLEAGDGLTGLADRRPGLSGLSSDDSMSGRRYLEAIEAFAAERDLRFDEAEALWLEIHAQILDLIDRGHAAEDAQVVVLAADHHGVDLGVIEALASDEGIGLVDAAALVVRAGHYAMAVPELLAYDGLNEHFDVFDNAGGGDADGKVSLEDLQHVVDHPDRFDPDSVAGAASLLAAPGLLARLDTGRDNHDVLADGARFGRDDFDDRTISTGDIEDFEWKQGVNALIGVHHDAIDAANGGTADGHLSRADFAVFLDENRGQLTDREVQALQIVIDGELYDKGWLERNKRSLAIAAAVVAGAVVAVGTGGIGSGISGAMITAAVTGAAGATAASATTSGINGLSDESDWDDDLLINTGHGFLGGMAGGGLGVAGPAWGATSGVGRFGVASGVASDGAAIVGMGGIDWGIDTLPGVDHDDLGHLHDAANRASLALGVTGLAAAGAQGAANLYNRNMAAGTAAALPDSVVVDLETFTTNGVPGSQARAWLDEHPDGIAMLAAAFDSQVLSTGGDVDFFVRPLAERLAIIDEVRDRLVPQVVRGVEVPVVRETSESLYKVVPAGQDVSQYSPSWMTRDQLDNLVGNRRDLPDALGLPYVSHADEYRVWRIDPIGDQPISVFASEIAPTTELYGMVTTRGGAEQVLVPNRSLYHDAVIDITEPIINRSNGGMLAPAREVGSVIHGFIDEPVVARSPADDLSVHRDTFAAPTVREESTRADP